MNNDNNSSELTTRTLRFAANLQSSEYQTYGEFYRKTVGKFKFGNTTLAEKFPELDSLVAACIATRPRDIRCELDNDHASYPGGITVQRGARQNVIITVEYDRAQKGPPPMANGQIVQPSDCDKAIHSGLSGDLLVMGTLSIGKLNTDRIQKGSLRINGKDYVEEFARVCKK
jgi:hypothetical protein